MIELVVYGQAQPAGSKTVGFTKSGRHFVRDSAKGSADWKRTVAQVAGARMISSQLFDGPLNLEVRFFLPRPKAHFRTNGALKPTSAMLRPTTRPDATKLLRAVEDALTGIVWRDDSQVVEQHVEKWYGEPARVEIRVTRLTNVQLGEQVIAAT